MTLTVATVFCTLIAVMGVLYGGSVAILADLSILR